MGRRLTRGVQLAAELHAATGGALPATVDVGEVVGLLGRHPAAVLIPPPTVEPATVELQLLTWQLYVLAASGVGDSAAWQQLDDALDQLVAAVGFDRAQPAAYQLPDGSSHPAYLVTITEDS